jgi:hypothetical protein
MITLAANDTLETIIAKQDAAAEQARRDRFNRATTWEGKALATGLLITCDDAFDNAMRHAGAAERARQNGTTVRYELELVTTRNKVRAAVRYLESLVRDGESPSERVARIAPILAAVKGQEEGMKRPCRHNSTKTKQGWRSYWGEDKDAMICCRCGEVSPDLTRTEGPSEQAQIAAMILRDVVRSTDTEALAADMAMQAAA